MVFSALGFSVMVFLVKWASGLSRTPIGSAEAVLLRSFPMGIMCLVALFFHKNSRRALTQKEVKWLLSRGAIGALSMSCLFYAGIHIPLAMTSLLQNTSVFFTAIFAHLFLSERMSWQKFVAILGGLVAVVFLLGEDLSVALKFKNPWDHLGGYFIGLMSGVLSGVAYLSVRKVRHLPTTWIILSLSFFGCLLPGIWLLLSTAHFPTEPLVWSLLLGASVPAVVAQYAMTWALTQGPSTSVSLGQYAGPFFSTVLGFIFLNETLTLYKALGGVLLIAFAAALPFVSKRKAFLT
jgi:drug/metabolite transporter (DMT)-like permease